MLSELGLLDIGSIGMSTVGVISILMVLTGRLVPQKYYEEACNRLKEEQTDTRNWRRVAETALQQNSLLLQKDDVSITTLQAIRESIEAEDAKP